MKGFSKGVSTGSGGARFGTFAGVFTPTVLTILGLVLFLRVGWVVGEAGLLNALVIIALANLISMFTGLSLASIATNMRVRTGGTYYMISRTLGLEIGGAIGIPLYLSQAISVAFYIIGFTEALTALFPGFDPRMTSTAIAFFFGLLAFWGADFIIKIQFVILAVLAASLLSFFLGGTGEFVQPEWFTPATAEASFWQIFAIFFPAVTGIMVGVSMSGDLRDARKSIPSGTLAAIGVTFLIYMGTAVWMAYTAPTAALVGDNLIMQKIARWPLLIVAGVWVSTLSSALGSIMAAPRTMQAIAYDRALPKVFGERLGSYSEPRLAVLVTTGIAVMVIWMGNLDFVAPIITMFFLNTYGMINLMAGIEKLVANPSFRPQFHVPWLISFLGAAGCYGAMFLISPGSTVIAILISYGVFIVLKRRSLKQDWGDIHSGLWFAITRFALNKLDTVPWSVKNWRPNIIVFTAIRHRKAELMEVGSWLTYGRGIVTFYNLLVGEFDELTGRGLRTISSKQLQKDIHEQQTRALVNSTIVDDFFDGVVLTLQTYGLAGLEPNVALIGWGRDPETQAAQLDLMSRLMALKKSTLFLHYDKDRGFGNRKRIDIWWRGLDHNAALMLILAHIIVQSPAWAGAKIRVIRFLDRLEGRGGAEEHIASLLKSARVEAEPVVLARAGTGESFADVLAATSRDSDLVMLGLGLPLPGSLDTMVRQINGILESSVSTLLVRSGESDDILDRTSIYSFGPPAGSV